jgi:arylsulfatase A-like enzyme
MFKQDYTPRKRGFDEHAGYYQGCESAFTHVSACCGAGSPTSDQNFTCTGHPHLGIYPPYESEDEISTLPTDNSSKAKDQKGYDWFKSDPTNTTGVSEPDFSANHTNSATLIRDAAIDFLGRHKAADATGKQPFFLYLPFQNIHGPYTCEKTYRDEYANNTHNLTDAEQTMFGYLTEMDHMVGAITATLKANGQYENSVIIFSRCPVIKQR